MKKIIPIIIGIISIIFFITAFILLVKDKEDAVKKYQEKIDSLNSKIENINKQNKEEQEKNEKVLKECDETLSYIKSTFIGKNLSGEQIDLMGEKYVTDELFYRLSPFLIYMNESGNVVSSASQAKIYFYNTTDFKVGIFYKKNVKYSDLELIYANDEVAVTKIIQSSSTEETTYYPIFVKDGDNWQLNSY
jgi:hypothetical protein